MQTTMPPPVIDTTAFTGTVLPGTEDAGEEYVKETLFLRRQQHRALHDDGKRDLTNAIGVTSMSAGQITSLKCVDFKGYSSYVTIPEAVKIMHSAGHCVLWLQQPGRRHRRTTSTPTKRGLAAIHEAYPSCGHHCECGASAG